MQHSIFDTFRPAPDYPPSGGPIDAITSRDAIALLRLQAHLAALRTQPRQWRLELLGGILQLFPAAAAAAFTLKSGTGTPPLTISIVETGLRTEPQRQALLREFNAAPLGDPLGRAMLQQFQSQRPPALTCLRADVVNAPAWQTDPHILLYRKATGTGDCILSLLRGERDVAHALLVMRTAITPPQEGGPDPRTDVLAAATFAPRERLLLHVLHRGVEALYRAEESSQKMNRATALRPRLRETLDLILQGHTERQAAERMNLSVHTVHDYVKSLYIHFGVSSRTELLARWVQNGGTLPRRRE